ncbi:MAG TPA: peptidoglycan bridge formation glycyltransferase FemA/FemB family protein [Myxococcota bacterium]|mgnify:CR=1 FL=1|nr:peptidoglycan bridge formation glycyltransferase FemA/FemB family protein [Myxococcota bacterium]HOD06746.1 peptidoglycan bridge formation glycyltransferase FemA/FemB family protein [Myxococcota bacterium]HPB51625.1 peptidoglycan bridge formation glycyltransferase FemA/FemB family protein [Myxococcota bacterium]HQP95369.1 peptidoglycan bridge formation glycyltransferase FemA/FemB family protein [Myxococcota bacterium]
MEIDLESKPVSRLVPTDIVFQTPFWAAVKGCLGWNTLAYDFSCKGVDGDVLLLQRAVGGNSSVVYVPQGPEVLPDEEARGLFLESLAHHIRGTLGTSTRIVRFDLPWRSVFEPGKDDDATDFRPGTHVREMRMNFGTRTWNLRAAPSDVFAPVTMVLDLSGSPDQILTAMKPKTRYNIRLAQRKGVVVKSMPQAFLPAFHRMYVETARRDGFPVPTLDHLTALFAAADPAIDDVDVEMLCAFKGDEILAGAIIAYSEKCAIYLHGASYAHMRDHMASYAVQWAVINSAKRRGCTSYDMFGVSPQGSETHPLTGVRRFKAGFGGQVVQRAGTWDYPFDDDLYEAFKLGEMLM